jgi:hypothetical protein
MNQILLYKVLQDQISLLYPIVSFTRMPPAS